MLSKFYNRSMPSPGQSIGLGMESPGRAFNSNWFTPKGSGGVEANAKRAEKETVRAQQAKLPVQNAFADYLAGKTQMDSLPQWMQTPDWQTTQNQVYNAFSNLGRTNADDAFRTNRAAFDDSMLRRGFINPSSLMSTGTADITNSWMSAKAQADANALLQSLGIGQGIRGEAGKNYFDMYNIAGDMSGANAYQGIANQYGQMGANQMAGIGGLLGTVGSIAGGFGGFGGASPAVGASTARSVMNPGNALAKYSIASPFYNPFAG